MISTLGGFNTGDNTVNAVVKLRHMRQKNRSSILGRNVFLYHPATAETENVFNYASTVVRHTFTVIDAELSFLRPSVC
jgi:hypothetical protein